MKKKPEETFSKNILIAFLSFLVGGLLVFIFVNDRESFHPKFSENRYKDKYPYISPLLECDTYESRELSWFDNKIKDKADELMSNGNTSHISYYFRDLNNGV